MKLSPEVLELLQQDPIRNANILGFAESYPLTRVEVVGRSVLIIGISDKPWVYISSECAKELRELVKLLSPTDVNFAIIEDWMLPIICSSRTRKWTMTTLRLTLPAEIALPSPLVPTTELTAELAEYLYNNYSYQEYTDVAYIAERITKGPSAGAFVGDKLVAWALTHDDGAIGMLHALEEYRGRGYAQAVTATVVKLVRAEGKVPFVHIEETNAKSLGLAKKLGFVVDRRVHWFELDKEKT